jgi:hypothetical protein
MMITVELRERLSALGSSELERLMQVVVKEYVERNPDAAAYFSPEILTAGLGQAAADAGLAAVPVVEPDDKTEVLRAIALELAEEPRYATLLGNALAVDRPTRVDPVTASIVLAGIVLVLQTRFEVSYDHHNGKRKLHIAISKAPTSENLIAKLFGLFKVTPPS